jgi:hypothetical protein
VASSRSSHPQKGTQVTRTTPSARTPFLRTGIVAALRGGFGGGGSGAGFSGAVGGRGTAALRLAGLLALGFAALFVLTASSALAATINKPVGEIIGPEPGVHFAELKSESVAVNDKNGHIYVGDSGTHLVYDFESAADTTPEVWNGGSSPQGGGTPAGKWVGNLALAVDNSTGDVYVSDSSHSVIEKFDQNGNPIATFGDTEVLGVPAPDGQLAGIKAPATSFLPPENFAFGIAVDQATGDIYVIDAGHEVIDVFSSEGAYLEQFTATPEGLYNGGGFGTDGIAVAGKSGELLVSVFAVAKTYRFDLATRAFIGEIDGSETPAGSFGGGYTSVAAADSGGSIYINDNPDEVVDRYESDATYSGSQIKGLPTENYGGLAIDQLTGDLFVAENPSGEGVIRIFGPPLIIPAVTTRPAVVHSTTSATFEGEVNPAGIAVTECFFEYGPTTSYGHTAECEPDDAALGEGTSFEPVHADLTGLTPGVYHYRLVAANANGTNSESEDRELVTGATIDATSASEVTSTTATLETEVNPHGLPTTYSFRYGPTTAYGAQTPMPPAPLGEGIIDVARSAFISGLSPSTTYHFQVIATNTLGTVEGPDRTFTTQPASASTGLPGDRGDELVSPLDKHGVPLGPITREGALIEAAADGHAITYYATGPILSDPAGSRAAYNSQVLSSRSSSGNWSTIDITPPHRAPIGATPGNNSEYLLFSTDLSRAALEPIGATPLSPLATEHTPYLRASDGAYQPLVTAANVPPGTKFGGVEEKPEVFANTVRFVTATPDLSHLLLSSPSELVAGFATSGEAVYEWSEGTLTPVSFVPSGSAAVCEGIACVPGRGEVGNLSFQVRNAISTNGSRVVFSALGQKLFLRDIASGETLQLDAPEEGCGGCGSGTATFQYASTDGSRVFFTDAEGLTADSTAAPGKADLYMCEIEIEAGHLSCDLTDLTANAIDPGEPAAVQGAVIGGAVDGSSVYFVADAALSEGEGAVRGNCAGTEPTAAETCNLYRYDTETSRLSLVAVLSGADYPDWAAETAESGGKKLQGLTARVSPDGRFLAFMSERPITGYDNRDAASGERDEEVFLYAAAADRLVCASCNPTGARPAGRQGPRTAPAAVVDAAPNWGGRWYAANVPGWTNIDNQHALYQSRYLSDSGRLFFNSPDALVPTDTNGTEDVYQYEPSGVGSCTEGSAAFAARNGGCVSLISSGTSAEESAFMDASEDGNDVFFLTAARLTARDEDKALDIYDASVGGGEPALVKPVECSGDACQQPAVPPAHPTPGTLLVNGPENVKQCPKGKVQKGGKCVKKQQKKKGKHKKKGKKKNGSKSKKQKRADSKHGGHK